MTETFMQAIKEGRIDDVRKLLDADASLANARDEQGRNALYWAALYGCNARTRRLQPIVNLLMDRGATIDVLDACLLNLPDRIEPLLWEDPALGRATDPLGLTPLHYAAMRGSAPSAKVLLDYAADVNARDSHGLTPLHYAAHPGPLKPTAAEDVVRVLRDAGAEVDLLLAAALGDTDRINQLLDADPDAVNQPDEFGATPLYHAAHNLQIEVVRQLLERGGNPNFPTRDGQTALSTAVGHRWDAHGPAVIELLLQHGAEPDLFDAAALGHAERVTELLAADPEAANTERWGLTAVKVATRSGHTEIGRQLVAAGAVPDLHDAAGLGLLEQLEQLATAHPEAIDAAEPGSGHTPLHRAAENGCADAAEMLLRHGASVDATTAWGATALHLAAGPILRPEGAEWGRTIRILLEHGANPELKDQRDSSPMDYARHEGMTEALDILRRLL